MENNNNNNQLKYFTDNLPAKPYCSNDLAYGLQIRPAKTAMTAKYIQHNKPTQSAWLVFDCDYPGALEDAEFNNLPAPNIVVINRENGHSHLMYSLETPVYTCSNARLKPLRYLAAIDYSLTKALKADTGYVGKICKNPLHEDWLTCLIRAKSWSMGEFAEYLTLPTKLPKKALEEGYGRNCTMFELLRKWAYIELVKYTNHDKFLKACYNQAASFNIFPHPLSEPEIRGIAKSVGQWTWKYFDAQFSNKKFSSLQSYRGKLGGIASGESRFEGSLTQSKPWKLEGISRSLWYERNKAA
ncbi:replication initiation protein [Castellaniella sp.]|uniref:replication initiation protein n=1 Tax=Castellaniella sp. TaxID=1955812 RepID=UPI003A8E3B1E